MATTHAPLTDLESWFDATPGADRTLLPWDRMQAWLEATATASDRIHVESLGTTEGGNDMLLVVASAPETIRDLHRVRERRKSLSNRDLLLDPDIDAGTLAGDKTVVLVTAGIHATEVGGVQLMPELVRDLAFSSDERILRHLDRTIILIVPTLNPDGMTGVHEWYSQTLGTRHEGSNPPWLYHPYAGHDNNRDWYTHALTETRMAIDGVHRPWHPHVVLDLHQMWSDSPRYVVPPYIDPAEPNVHPRILALSSDVGSSIAAAHIRAGHRGTASGVMFDAYSPTRAYQHYHGGVRILAEAASAKIATPIDIDVDTIKPRRGFDPNLPGVHCPDPWPGGRWTLRDIMDRHRTSIDALLDHASTHRDMWLRDQWAMFADETRRPDPVSWVISPLRFQQDPAAAVRLVDIMQRGDVEVGESLAGVPDIPEGSIVVRSDGPFGTYARALLDLAPYPTPRTTPGQRGTQAPYDVTTHCLPLHMGVEVRRIDGRIEAVLQPVDIPSLRVFPAPSASDVRRGQWLAIDHRSHAAIEVVAHALRNGAAVSRLLRPHVAGGRLHVTGTWLVTDDHVFASISEASRRHIRTTRLDPIPLGSATQSLPRIALHMPSRGNAIDAGWLRLALERMGLPFTLVSDSHIREGGLNAFDVLLLAHLPEKDLLEGNASREYPDAFAGGLGAQGIAAIDGFIRAGGHLIAIDHAAKALRTALGLPFDLPLDRHKRGSFACPGSILAIEPNPAHPLTLGLDEPLPVMFEASTAFRPHQGSSALLPALYARHDLLLSGWMHGADHIAGLGAIIDVPLGAGRFTGFGFRPHYRMQMLASLPLLSNAIMRAGLGSSPRVPKDQST